MVCASEALDEHSQDENMRDVAVLCVRALWTKVSL